MWGSGGRGGTTGNLSCVNQAWLAIPLYQLIADEGNNSLHQLIVQLL